MLTVLGQSMEEFVLTPALEVPKASSEPSGLWVPTWKAGVTFSITAWTLDYCMSLSEPSLKQSDLQSLALFF